MIERILSPQNQYVKLAMGLKQKKKRESTGLFIAEGLRLAEEAIASGWRIPVCLFTREAYLHERGRQVIEQLQADTSCKVMQVSDSIYSKVTDTDQPQGLMVLVGKKRYQFDDVILNKQNPLILVLDGLQDPGNVGTIIRTADAAGCSGVLMTKGSADLFSGKTVRAGMGSIFHLPIIEGLGCGELVALLSEYHIPLMATALTDSEIYFSSDLTMPVAVVFGNEGNGVQKELLQRAKVKLYIPILGKAESLNVAAAASVILYEAVRQRLLQPCVS
ncbi:MAG: RNA methyltransferase [Veillonellales bacterium]